MARIFKESLEFLLPNVVIKQKHLRKKDIKRVKGNITDNFTPIRVIGAIVLYVLSFGVLIWMGVDTNWKQVEVYGLGSILSQIFSMFGCLLCIVLTIVGRFIKNKSVTTLFSRIAGDILFAGIAAQLLLGLYADAQMGYTTVTETLSASVVFITILVLLQPSYWSDAVILDGSFTVAFIFVCLLCKTEYGMKAIHYYMLLAFIYPFCCYLVISIIFYAESQHYREMREKERLTNKAYYDNLTECKNRHALVEFLKENTKNWENKDNVNLLIILFDIDNFKEYNDQFSHLGGDYCLKSIADAIRKTFPSPSLDFFRYGGEEFLLFFEVDDANDAPKIMEEVRKAIKKLDIQAPKGAPKDIVTISLGGMLLQNIQGFSFENELAVVDSYLYMAKASGKDASCYNGSIIK